jgi:hypothetical protein
MTWRRSFFCVGDYDLFSSFIPGAVLRRFNSATMEEVNRVIGAWLAQSKDMDGGRKERQPAAAENAN